MALFEFSQGAAMFDVTPVENMFLLEYLPSVPEGFLRPYLYARMLALHPELATRWRTSPGRCAWTLPTWKTRFFSGNARD